MQQVYYKRITTYQDHPNQHEVSEVYISYGLSRKDWLEICRTPPVADIKERQRLVAAALNIPADQIELVRK